MPRGSRAGQADRRGDRGGQPPARGRRQALPRPQEGGQGRGKGGGTPTANAAGNKGGDPAPGPGSHPHSSRRRARTGGRRCRSPVSCRSSSSSRSRGSRVRVTEGVLQWLDDWCSEFDAALQASMPAAGVPTVQPVLPQVQRPPQQPAPVLGQPPQAPSPPLPPPAHARTGGRRRRSPVSSGSRSSSRESRMRAARMLLYRRDPHYRQWVDDGEQMGTEHLASWPAGSVEASSPVGACSPSGSESPSSECPASSGSGSTKQGRSRIAWLAAEWATRAHREK